MGRHLITNIISLLDIGLSIIVFSPLKFFPKKIGLFKFSILPCVNFGKLSF